MRQVMDLQKLLEVFTTPAPATAQTTVSEFNAALLLYTTNAKSNTKEVKSMICKK